MRAELVRLIGGPTGASVGRPGPTGPSSLLLPGATGLAGLTGLQGMTGKAGAAGLYAALAGMMGAQGPIGSTGYPGYLGYRGSNLLVPDDSYFFSGQNLNGFTPFQPTASAAGCKFRYVIKGTEHDNGTMVFAFFTAQYTDVTKLGYEFSTSIIWGTGAAPDAGVWGGYPNFGNDINITYIISGASDPPRQMAVFCAYVSQIYPYQGFPQDRWWDLAGSYGGNVSFAPAGGQLSNITATIFEVPL